MTHKMYELIVSDIDRCVDVVKAEVKSGYWPSHMGKTHEVIVFSDEEGTIYAQKGRKLKPGQKTPVIRKKYPPHPNTQLYTDDATRTSTCEGDST